MKPLWSWRQAVAESGLPAMTKHVLSTLALHMTETGENCWPSLATLCRESSLSKPAVLKHLKAAAEAGWVRIEERQDSAGDRTSNRYHPLFPGGDGAGRGGQRGEPGGQRGLPPPLKSPVHKAVEGDRTDAAGVVNEVDHPGNVVNQGGQRRCPRVVNDVYPKENPDLGLHLTPPQPPQGGDGVGKSWKAGERPPWAAFEGNWPWVEGESRVTAKAEWDKLDDDAAAGAVTGIGSFKAAVRRQGRKLCHARTYLAERRWEGLKPKTDVFAIYPDSASWSAWKAYHARRAGGREIGPGTFMVKLMRDAEEQFARGVRKGISERTAWPPGTKPDA